MAITLASTHADGVQMRLRKVQPLVDCAILSSCHGRSSRLSAAAPRIPTWIPRVRRLAGSVVLLSQALADNAT